jgi:hypothetical protein
MNLYNINFLHASPKDREYGIKCLLLADNDEEVYNFIKSEPDIDSDRILNGWDEYEKRVYDETKDCFVCPEGYEEQGWWDEDGKPIQFKDFVMNLKGEMYDEGYDYTDAYYGITLYGWSLQKQNLSDTEIEVLKGLDIVKSLDK